MPVSLTAMQVATYVRRRLAAQERGALVVQGTADDELVLAVFGNDRYRFNKRVNSEVEWVRRRLTAAGARELGFGVSEDGSSWALLFEAEPDRFHTAAGRMFQRELLAIHLEEVVWDAWRSVTVKPAEAVASA